MWVYRSPEQDAIYFDYNRGRDTSAAKRCLAGFEGFLQTDGYAVYPQFGIKDVVTLLACWAHARRKFDEAKNNDKQRAEYVLTLIQNLYAIERHATDMEMTPEQRHALRLDKSLDILNKISAYIMENRSKVLPRSPIGKAFEYCINLWDELNNYLMDGRLEIDNNNIENAIRPLALGRKNYLFAGSHEAAENIAMYYSFFGTCKKHDINPHKWLTYAINHVAITKKSELKNLLPQFINKKLVE
jgi:hypothetical protein